jgi:hypothetical protein
MWTALTGTLEKMQQQHHYHYHHHRHPHYYKNCREPSSCGPLQVRSIPRRQRHAVKALVAVLVVMVVLIVIPLASLRSSSGGGTSRSERIARKMHQLKDFFVTPEDSSLDMSSASSAADAQAEDAESMADAAAATELLTVDSLPDVPRRRLTEEEEEDGKAFAPLEQDNGNQEGDNSNGDVTNDENKENERDSNNGNDNNSSEPNTNNALSLSLMLSMWTDQREEHSLLVRLAVQRALRDILCQSNEVVVLSFPSSNSDSNNERWADTATNVCLAGGGGTNRQLNAVQTHRAAAWEDVSANGYYTVLESSPTILQRDEQVSYIPYQVWTINFPVLNMGALYKNQVSTNQQYLESSSSGSNNATNGAADDVVASDGAIQMAALSIFAGEIQRKLDRLLASGSFEATMNLYALGATSHSSVVGNEYETFSKVVPAPLHPITAFFNKTFDEWTWDPIHIACVALLGSLVIGMTVLMCLLCRRRKFKVAYPNNQGAAKRGSSAFDKNYHSGSSTGNDETLSVGFPDVLGAGTGSVRKIQGSDDGSVHSLYAASLPPMDTVSLAQSDSRMEEGLPSDDVFDPAVYAYLDAEQHYAQASAVDEDDLRGGWGSCLIPLPGSLRKQKSASSTKTKGSSQSKSSKAAAEVGTGILRPPSYSTSGPVDVDEARNNQSALEAYGDSKDDEDRNGWSSSSSCTSEGVTLAYETDLDATVEIDMDTGYRLNKRMKKVAFKYVETNRSMSPDRQCLGGDRDVDIDDGLISDLDDEGSFCSLYGGATAFRESSSRVIRRKSLSGGDAADTVNEGASVPVDIDSLLTADQVGMMPTEIGTCATLGLSTEAEDKAAENKGMDPTSSDDNNVAPLATLGQSVRKAASILGLKR